MRKGFIQAEEFGFPPEASGEPRAVYEYILLFLTLRKVVVDTRIKRPWIRTLRRSGWPWTWGQLGPHGVGQGVRKWPDPIPTDGKTEAHSSCVTSPE